MPTMPVSVPPAVPMFLPDSDKAARAAELQARIQNKLATVGLDGTAGTTPGY